MTLLSINAQNWEPFLLFPSIHMSIMYFLYRPGTMWFLLLLLQLLDVLLLLLPCDLWLLLFFLSKRSYEYTKFCDTNRLPIAKKHFELIVIGYDLFWPELKIRVMSSNKGKKTNFFTFLWYNTWENFISVTKLISYCSIDNLLYQMWQKNNKVVRDLVCSREL